MSSVHRVFSWFNNSINKGQFILLQVAALCLGVPRGIAIDSTLTVSDVEKYLDNVYPKEGTTLVYGLLTCIGVDHNELKHLVPFIDSVLLKNCETSNKFLFAKLCINVCTSMSEEDYKQFFGLCVAELDHAINIEKFPTPASLLIELIKQGKISVKDVKFLCDKLEHTGLMQTLETVQEYRQKIGSLAQEGSGDQIEKKWSEGKIN